MKKPISVFVFLAVALCCWTTTAQAQIKMTWQMLSDVKFEDKFNETVEAYYWYPTFGEAPKAFEGKEVYVTGFLIPVDIEGDFYVLSRYTFDMCFFCGQAGPESIVELQFAEGHHRDYKLDQRVTFKGVLRLNSDDIDHCNYILEGATEY